SQFDFLNRLYLLCCTTRKYKEITALVTVYGIKNCDTIKKARKWLTDNGIDYTFHDVRADGIDAATIENWIEKTDWETVLNRRGTTWRKLDSSAQEATNRDTVTALLLEQPAMIKRPVLEVDGAITIGFKADQYQTIFN
ncbi:ArsC family reductase, partial [Porticoccaceae bacterium]|nr:ArsC family reductase [Porticoccaceae bacterium]